MRLLFVAAALAALPALAQEPVIWRLGDAGDTLGFAFDELTGSRIVKGAPYCADAEQESIVTLADGNRIVRKQTQRMCRDGEGRTRQELTRARGAKIVYLRDPLLQRSWVVRGDAVQTLGSADAAPDEAQWRAYAQRMREWARELRPKAYRDGEASTAPPAPPTHPVMPAQAVIEGTPPQDLRVLRIDLPSAGAAVPPLPPAVLQRAQFGAPRGAGVVTSLGSKEIEGVRAHGERTTWTIEAGRIGNEKPIVITRDVWMAPELMLTLLVRDVDPRSGEQVWRVVNLKRGEPDPALMRPPGKG